MEEPEVDAYSTHNVSRRGVVRFRGRLSRAFGQDYITQDHGLCERFIAGYVGKTAFLTREEAVRAGITQLKSFIEAWTSRIERAKVHLAKLEEELYGL